MSFERTVSPGALSREATARLYERHHLARGVDAGAWEELAAHFAADASYFDAFYGWTYGRDAIARFLREAMKGFEDWAFPVQWTSVTEGRVVAQLLNRAPGLRPGGGHYEFPSVSTIVFDDRGEIAQQVDVYDTRAAVQTVVESKLGPRAASARRALRWVGPAVRTTLETFNRRVRGG